MIDAIHIALFSVKKSRYIYFALFCILKNEGI